MRVRKGKGENRSWQVHNINRLSRVHTQGKIHNIGIKPESCKTPCVKLKNFINKKYELFFSFFFFYCEVQKKKIASKRKQAAAAAGLVGYAADKLA